MEALMTGTSRNLLKTIDYIGDDTTKAHPNDNAVERRNIALGGVGVRTDGIQHTIDDFRLLSIKRPQVKVQTLNYVISPAKNEVDPNNPQQVKAFKRFCVRVARGFMPDHLAYVAIQHDNKHDIVHAHLIFSNISTVAPHHAINHSKISNARFRRVAERVRTHGFSNRNDTLQLSHIPQSSEDYRTDRTIGSDLIIKGKAEELMDNLANCRSHKDVRTVGKSLGLIVKFPRAVKHRAYKMTPDGKHYVYKVRKNGSRHKIPLYKKRKDGHYMYKTNRHGNKHRIPVYIKPQGILFKLDPAKYGKSSPNKYGKTAWTKGYNVGIHGTRVQAIIDRNRKAYRHAKRAYEQSTAPIAKSPQTAKNEAIDDDYYANGDNGVMVATDEIKRHEAMNSQNVAELPDISPEIASMSTNGIDTLNDDIDLLPKLSHGKHGMNEFTKGVTESHQRHGIDDNENSSTNKQINNALRKIISVTEADAERLKEAVRYYDKFIAKYLAKARKKAVQTAKRTAKRAKIKVVHVTHKVRPHIKGANKILARLNHDAKISQRERTKLSATKPTRVKNHDKSRSKARKSNDRDAFAIGRERNRERAERARQRQSANRSNHSNNIERD